MLNKNIFLDSYNSKRDANNKFNEIIKMNPIYFTSEKLIPVNKILSHKETDNTICSVLSRVKINNNYEEILKNKKNYNIFSTLSKEKENIWFYIDKKNNNLVGPLNNFKMDDLFKNNWINEYTLIKKKYDDNFFKLLEILKVFYHHYLNKIFKK